MFNKFISDNNLDELAKQYANANPYKYVIIDDFLDVGVAEKLAKNFPSLEQMATSYNGLNERKAEHSELSSLATEFQQLKTRLFDPEFVRKIEAITGMGNLMVIDDRFGYGLHQGGNGSFLDVHIDYNLHPTKRKHRRLNLILFLNLEWHEDWGGMLQLWNENATECKAAILPKFNRCVIFECSDVSFHGYNQISCPENITRKSFYTYFFSEPDARLKFHDTVFKPKPNDAIGKKVAVHLKELIKNSLKRMLYNVGAKRFLK